MNSGSIKLKTVFIHLSFWGLYVLLEYLANIFHIPEGQEVAYLKTILYSLPVIMIPAYFIALFAVPKFLQKKKWLLFGGSLILAAVFAFLARQYWMVLINYLEHGHVFKMPMSKVFKNVIRDYSVIALAVCIYIIGDWRKKQALNEELIKSRAEAELQLLKGQLQPHFLFNTLNNIYSLALLKSEATADSILKLTELLDYLVYRANKKSVLLAREVELLKHYLDLEALRYGEKLKLDARFEIKNDIQKIAPLILLPFVENCFKHGSAGENGVFSVKIHLKADVSQLIFEVQNSKKNISDKIHKNGGVGLENIKKRLQLIYPGKHRLNISSKPTSFEVKMEIDF